MVCSAENLGYLIHKMAQKWFKFALKMTNIHFLWNTDLISSVGGEEGKGGGSGYLPKYLPFTPLYPKYNWF